jgi:hypothetical protein
MPKLKAKLVVIVLCLSLLAVGVPAAKAQQQTNDTWDCYPVEDGAASVCAAIHWEDGRPMKATYYYSSPQGSGIVVWERGSEAQVVHLRSSRPARSRLIPRTVQPPGATALLGDPDPIFPDPNGGCDSDEYYCEDCAPCIANQDRLCQSQYDAAGRAAIATTATETLLCAALLEIPALYAICVALAIAHGLTLVDQAVAQLDQCRDQAPRNCVDSLGRPCRR